MNNVSFKACARCNKRPELSVHAMLCSKIMMACVACPVCDMCAIRYMEADTSFDEITVDANEFFNVIAAVIDVWNYNETTSDAVNLSDVRYTHCKDAKVNRVITIDNAGVRLSVTCSNCSMGYVQPVSSVEELSHIMDGNILVIDHDVIKKLYDVHESLMVKWNRYNKTEH